MELTDTSHGSTLEVAIRGNVDTASAGPLEQHLLAAIERGVRYLLLHCAEMDYINSTGLKVMLIAAKKLDAAGGKLAISGLSENVRTIFEMIGFTQIFTILPTREEGVRVLAETGAAA